MVLLGAHKRMTSNSKHTYHYYPFGMQIAERSATFATNSYRYGFNGMEKDNEVKGSGNSLDFGARIYDSRLGRWLAMDPMQSSYPSLSPYNFVANSPLIAIDPNGKEIVIHYKDENGNDASYSYGSALTPPNNEFVQQTVQALDYIKEAGEGKRAQKTIDFVSKSPTMLLNIVEQNEGAGKTLFSPVLIQKSTGMVIKEGDVVDINDVKSSTGTIKFDPLSGNLSPDGERTSPATGLAHEIGHVFGAFFDTQGFLSRAGVPDPEYDNLEEYFVTKNFEWDIAEFGFEWKREDHHTGEDYTSVSSTSNVPSLTDGDDLGQGKELNL